MTTSIALPLQAVARGDIFLTTKIPCAGNASGALDYVRTDLQQLGLE